MPGGFGWEFPFLNKLIATKFFEEPILHKDGKFIVELSSRISEEGKHIIS